MFMTVLAAASVNTLTALLVPLIVFVAICVIIGALVDRFSPDPTITYITRIVLFVMILVAIIKVLLPIIAL